MANRTWTGGGDNQSNNPSDWEPYGVPENGDNLIVPYGSIIIDHKNYNADAIYLGEQSLATIIASTVNVDGSVSSGPLNDPDYLIVKGTDHLNLVGGNNDIVDLSSNSHWIGSFNVPHSLVVHADKATFIGSGIVNGSLSLYGTKLTTLDLSLALYGSNSSITGNIIGNSIINLNPYIVNSSSNLQITDSELYINGHVAKDVKINLFGGDEHGETGGGSLTIADPKHFQGSVHLQGQSFVELLGVHANSFSMKNDILSLYNNSCVVDNITIEDRNVFNGNSNTPFHVSANAAGISIGLQGPSSLTFIGPEQPPFGGPA